MAERSRPQTRNRAERSRATGSASVYEDFQPQIEQKEEQGANILLIHLPGFPKEHIRVIADSSRTIQVQGERPLEKNRRNRFNQAFPVPQNCIIEKIQASFRNGILTITMPKSTISVNEADTKKETVPPKPITEPKAPTAMSPQNASPKEQTNGKKIDALLPPKQEEENQKKAAPIATTSKQTDEKTAGSSTAEIVEEKAESKVEPKDLDKEKENGKTKDSTMSERKIQKISEMEKNDKAGGAVEEKPKEGVSTSRFLEKAKEIKGIETIMKTVKRLATDDYEDRKRLIHIGVSVFVILALGAYITYSYRSTKKAED